jgi:hypothetical protein
MRRQLRQHVLDRLRDLTSNDEEFRSEAQRLFGTASASAKASAFAKAAADKPADQE